LTAATSCQAALVYDEQVCASVTSPLLVGYPYCIEAADGRIEFGRIDPGGKLPRITSGSTAAEYFVYWGDEALARQIGVSD
jgi:hypothetical protein